MTDTIAAIATAPGMGGVSIVRLSGPDTEQILMRLFRPVQRHLTVLTSHMLTYGHVTDGEKVLDECMAVLMRAPRSYTREDVAELQLHGGGYIAQTVLALCLRHGARLAEAGEFTRRAFLNGRIDLSQAEAVMSLIAARGEQSRQAALRQLEGGASAFIRKAADDLYALQAGAAACIDYPEEISEEEAAADLTPKLLALAETLESACDERTARLLEQGLSVALCGLPNAGKSSLLNALLNEERAIVTDIPGTTRDVVTGELFLQGARIQLTDTAGLHDSDDVVEQIGMERARRAVEQADCILLLVDLSQPMSEENLKLAQTLDAARTVLIGSKSDRPQALSAQAVQALLPGAPVLLLSAAQPETLLPLKEHLARLAQADDRLALTQPRHLEAARRAARHLRQAADSMETMTVDFAAIDLQSAQSALSEITGDNVEEKLLDAVFSRFCVGK